MSLSGFDFSPAKIAASGIHAVLLYGSETAPLAEKANQLAALWLCKAASAVPCGECAACRAQAAGGSADLQVLAPFGNPPIYGMETIQEVKSSRADQFEGTPIRRFLRTPPNDARSKVVILQDFERANLSAANALLKTLEEPPAFARFILTSRALSRVMPTIRSRCTAIAVNEAEANSGGNLPPSWERRPLNDTIREALPGLVIIGDAVLSAQTNQALILSEQWRKWAEGLNDQFAGVRASQAFALEMLAEYLSYKDPGGFARIQSITTAHRFVLGNLNGTLLAEVLFGELIGTGSRSDQVVGIGALR